MKINKGTPDDLPEWAKNIIYKLGLKEGSFIYFTASLQKGDIIEQRNLILEKLKRQKVKSLGFRIENERIGILIRKETNG